MNETLAKSTDELDRPLTLQEKLVKELREWGITLSIFIPIFLVFSGLFYELRVIPSESMVPNLQVGDRVTVNKFAYGYSRNSLPFSLGRYVPLPEPPHPLTGLFLPWSGLQDQGRSKAAEVVHRLGRPR